MTSDPDPNARVDRAVVDGFCRPVPGVQHSCHGHQAGCLFDCRIDCRPDCYRAVRMIRVARQLKAVHRIRFVHPKPSVRPSRLVRLSHYGCASRMGPADFRLDCADHPD